MPAELIKPELTVLKEHRLGSKSGILRGPLGKGLGTKGEPVLDHVELTADLISAFLRLLSECFQMPLKPLRAPQGTRHANSRIFGQAQQPGPQLFTERAGHLRQPA